MRTRRTNLRFTPHEDAPARRRSPRRILLPTILTLLGFAVLICSVSAWNYYDITLQRISPTSDLSESPYEATGLSRIPNGKTKWRFHAGEPIAAAVVEREAVYIVSGRRAETGRITALRPPDTTPHWTFELSGVSDYPPAVAGDLLYAVTRDGRVIALQRDTGQVQWTYEANEILLGKPVVQDGVLYMASDGIHALDALSGELLWIHDTEGGRAISPLAHSQGTIAVLSEGNHLNLIDAVKGKRRFTNRLWFGGGGAPVILGDTVVVAGDGGSIQTVNLFARDIPMEKALRFWWTRAWVYKSAPRPPPPVGYLWHHRGIGGVSTNVVTAANDRLYLLASHQDHSSSVTAMDANMGEILWEYSSETQIAKAAVLSPRGLLIGDSDGAILVLDGETGRASAALTTGFPVSGLARASEGALLVTSEAGDIHLIY